MKTNTWRDESKKRGQTKFAPRPNMLSSSTKFASNELSRKLVLSIYELANIGISQTVQWHSSVPSIDIGRRAYSLAPTNE